MITDLKTVDLSDMPPLEGDQEEVKEETGLKVLTPNKLLTRRLLLLAPVKAGNNSKKLEKYSIFCISTTKSLKKFITILSSHYNNEKKYDYDDISQNLCFFWILIGLKMLIRTLSIKLSLS